MSIKLRKTVGWILAIFAIYAIFRSPQQAADVTRAAIDGVATMIGSIMMFFDSLLMG